MPALQSFLCADQCARWQSEWQYTASLQREQRLNGCSVGGISPQRVHAGLREAVKRSLSLAAAASSQDWWEMYLPHQSATATRHRRRHTLTHTRTKSGR